MNRCLILALGILLLLPQLALAGAKTYTDGMGDHQWNTDGNWMPNGVPVCTDDVTIPSPLSATVVNTPDCANTVTVDSGATLIINGSLQISSTSTFSGTLTLTGGPLTLGGDSTITGPMQLAGGTMSSVGSPTVKISGPTTVSITSTVGGGSKYFNTGAITIMNDGTGLFLGGTFNNQSVINIEGDSTPQTFAGIFMQGGGILNNAGTIAKTMGSGVSILQSFGQLNNSGTVSAGTGTLQVTGGNGTETGTFDAANGALLEFPAGEQSNFTLNTGTVFTGTGIVDITGGIWTLAGDVTVNTTTLELGAGQGAAIEGVGNLIVNSSFVTWNSGVIGSTGSLGNMTVSKNTVVNQVDAGDGGHSLGRNLDLFGTLNMNADLFLESAPIIKVEQGATFNIHTDSMIYGNGFIKDSGTFEKTGGAGTSSLSFLGGFKNGINSDHSTGIVKVISGTLNFAMTGTSYLLGTWTNESVISFTQGTYTFVGSGPDFEGSGTTTLGGAVWDVGTLSLVNTSILNFSSGTIQGASDLTVKSPNFTWSGGSMQGSGSTTIYHGVTTTITGSPSVGGRIIYSRGKVDLADSFSSLTLASATWNNEGTFTFKADGNIKDGAGNPSTFENSGTVRKTGGSKSSISFNGTFNNNANGKVLAEVGNLSLESIQGTSMGAWTADKGAVVTFNSFGSNPSAWTINAGTTMNGAGIIALTFATWNLTANLTVSSAKFDALPASKITGAFDLILTSPEIRFNGLVRQGQVINGQPDGTITIPGASAVTVEFGGLTLGACTFDNSTKVDLKAPVLLGNYAVFQNESAGQVVLDIESIFPAIGGDPTTTITNLGAITIGLNANHTQTISTLGIFNHFGTVRVLVLRKLNLSMGSGRSKGAHFGGSKTTLAFQAGTYTLSPGTVFNSLGTINLGGTWQVDSDTTIKSDVFQFGPSFSSNGGFGIIQGTANLAFSNRIVNCKGGTVNITSPGVVTLDTGAIVNSDPALGCTLAGNAINVVGELDATNGNYSIGAKRLTIQPRGILQFQGAHGLVNG